MATHIKLTVLFFEKNFNKKKRFKLAMNSSKKKIVATIFFVGSELTQTFSRNFSKDEVGKILIILFEK
jgi:hypothetical protein